MPDAAALRFGAIVLAAGGSSRMGTAKQLLEKDGVPLIARVVDEVLASGAFPVVVVLGAHEEVVRAAISGRPAIMASNPVWATGLAGSVKVGLTTLVDAQPEVQAVLLTPCDQPALTCAIILQLVAGHAASGRIACSRFNGRNASPAVFGRDSFEALSSLTGDCGARELLNADAANVVAIESPSLGLDLDTPADVKRWRS